MEFVDQMERNNLEELLEDELKTDGEDYLSHGYLKHKRDKGSGPIRIGTTCLFEREDLYTYIFVSCLHPEYVYAGDVESQERDDILAELRERAKRKTFGRQDVPYGVKVYDDVPPRPSTYKEEEEARVER